ncbi:MAG TPA: asparagine synthase (glutamine-hydrolyzing) [Saprospiraceae bacterium]|nr:asparagine synthase (glutamine-hydrolyzing) [Saprospiraceae bacterium]HNT19431.1 asparagine synthase (glutamine-hydrolyzing) [Saprospiraceae bacterium]
MCRLAGFIDPGLKLTDLIRMRDSMYRGGPDDQGTFVDEDSRVYLGHNRLSIIDLGPGGHQPMSDEGGQVHLIYNGEVYNYVALRDELTALGHKFKTRSDTEVILQAYLQWGNMGFSRLNGMFALAIWDKRKNSMILARDHAGIKPLYYAVRGGNLYFASEIKAFRALQPDWPEDKNWKIFFLAFGHIPAPRTTLQQVQSLAKGSILEFEIGQSRIKLHSFIPGHDIKEKVAPGEAALRVRSTLEQAIRRHLISDAPLGIFLSGGIDSSLLTLLAKPWVKEHLHTLSVHFNESGYSEKKYQDQVVQMAGSRHHEYVVTSADFDLQLPDALRAMDQPSTDAINVYMISGYAHRAGLKSVLSGIGADELFGGYPSVKNSSWWQWLVKCPGPVLELATLGTSDRYRKIKFATLKNSTGEYLFYRGLHTIDRIADILEADETEVRHQLDSMQTASWNGEDRLEKASWLEYHAYMHNQLLKDADYMSMWHSLEIRVPFLDKEFVELVNTMPSDIRFKPGQPKFLLIESCKDILPEAIWNRPKQGFTLPFELWMKTSEQVRPQTPKEEKYFQAFKQGRLSWARYWAIKMAGSWKLEARS